MNACNYFTVWFPVILLMNFITELWANNLLFLLNLLLTPVYKSRSPRRFILGIINGVHSVIFRQIGIIKQKKQIEHCGDLFKMWKIQLEDRQKGAQQTI